MSDDRIQSRERVFDGVKFAVDRVQLHTEEGETVDREVVAHAGSVAVLGVLPDRRVVMIRNQRFAVGKMLWELPAGTLEPDEPPADCAARELAEETGYRPGRVRHLCSFYTTPGICTEKMHVYLATELTHVGQALEAGERIEVELVAVPRLMEMLRMGQVEDAKSLAAILYYSTFGTDP